MVHTSKAFWRPNQVAGGDYSREEPLAHIYKALHL